jgi:hypothetical protein
VRDLASCTKPIYYYMTMGSNNDSKATYQDYGELWNFNLQKIEQIQLVLERSIQELESRYQDFESRYADIMQQLDILSSIYSGYNTIAGAEYVMRLKAVLSSYRKRHSREGIDFNLINNMLMKITEDRSACFENFPELTHDNSSVPIQEGGGPEESNALRKYKWITFERNRSWFIVPFKSVDVRINDNYPVLSVEEPDYLNIAINDNVYKVRDIFIKSLEYPDSPAYLIFIDRAQKNFAASRIGKRVYSDHNIVNPIVRPFRKVRENPLSPGRVRLFGKNHILLY